MMWAAEFLFPSSSCSFLLLRACVREDGMGWDGTFGAFCRSIDLSYLAAMLFSLSVLSPFLFRLGLADLTPQYFYFWGQNKQVWS